MRTPSEIDPDVATVVAAQRGDRRALDALAAAYLPLVYNIVGRAMNGHPDVDDVVQETMFRAVRGVGELRDVATDIAGLLDQALGLLRDCARRGRRVFRFTAHQVAGTLHLADHDSEIGLEEVDGLVKATGLDRRIRRGWRSCG